jgi:hypothetical protein
LIARPARFRSHRSGLAADAVRVINTTDSIKSLNYQLRKIIKTAATFPTTTR